MIALWYGLQLPYLAYELVKTTQETAGSGSSSGVKTLLLDTADVLSASGVQFGTLISNDTGIRVNVSQVRPLTLFDVYVVIVMFDCDCDCDCDG